MNSRLRSWWPLPLRLCLGVGFICHGAARLFTGPGHRHLAEALHQLGVPFAESAAWAVGGLELVGGVAVLEGLFLTVVAAVLIADLLAMTLAGHLPHGPFSLASVAAAAAQLWTGEIELSLLEISALLALLLGGPGPLSVSELVRRARAARSTAPPQGVRA